MARLEVNGIADMENAFLSMMDMPDSVKDDILNAEADVIVEAQQKNMAAMWDGPYATGDTARSVKKSRVKKWRGGKFITVTPEGTNKKGERNAAVAFVNEYGKRGQPARPAIQAANYEAEDRAVEAGVKVYNEFLDSKNL